MKSLFHTVTAAAVLLLSGHAWGEGVNLNSASVEELDKGLRGVGRGRAMAIVEYRDQHGPFTTIEEITKVRGIGRATLEINRERLRVQDDEGEPAEGVADAPHD